MEHQAGDIDYEYIIQTLRKTFGDVLSRECLITIIDSCGGDVEESANAIINITMDGDLSENKESENQQKPAEILDDILHENVTVNHIKPIQNVSSTSSLDGVPTTSNHIQSYAGASKKVFQSTKKQLSTKSNPTTLPNKLQYFWTDQTKRIVSYHQIGARVLVIMRGLPGSGKSFLARRLIDVMFPNQSHDAYKEHIFSTDDFFMHNNCYVFDKAKLSEYHNLNEQKARDCMVIGHSPVIIDNTNIEFWEMKSYVYEAVRNGYIIEVVEPITPWARKPKQLFKNTLHAVPYRSIVIKNENFQSGFTGDFLIRYFKYQYPPSMKPPILRLSPPICKLMPETNTPITSESEDSTTNVHNDQTINLTSVNPQILCHSNNVVDLSITQNVVKCENIDKPNHKNSDAGDNASNNDLRLDEIKNYLEKMEKLEEEWENNDDWNDDTKNTEASNIKVGFFASKPQRTEYPRSSLTQKKKLLVENSQDWIENSKFWEENQEPNHSQTSTVEIKPVIEKKSSSTCIELGDTEASDFTNPLKIVTATPRDINEFYMEIKKNKIPEKLMLDKSTSTSNTSNQILNGTQRCENEEHHFKSFRKLFKNIPRADLRDIFDNCRGDVNWAVDIVLDGVDNQQLVAMESDDISDTEEVQNENLCQCLSAYDILPDHTESLPQPVKREQWVNKTSSPAVNVKKNKKETVISEESMQLKRQIEENFTISDNHYSKHCLRIRKIRHGDTNDGSNNDDEKVDSNFDNTDEHMDANLPSTSGLSQLPVDEDTVVCVANEDNTNRNELVEYGISEDTVNINVGSMFIQQLDQLFGRCGIEYPTSIEPKLNIRQSLLNEINALWLESLMHQLEENAKQTDLMIKQDEEFARQLLLKENELLKQGKEPEVPAFKEIMDMDYALVLYHRDVEEWRNKEPKDLAAKLTREKLYNLFPELAPALLSELLAAHDNNFQVTVETLLMSTGRAEVLNEQNGVSKFVMKKEIERQEMILEKERQALSEVEWPLLPSLETVDMETVQRYRDEADKHLQSRNLNYQKAQEYIRRGMTQVASYYSDFANYHTMKYEQSNSMAAASLMQLHATNCPDNATIDLHYLRVGEARESLDLFLDTHIQKLRESHHKNGVTSHTLFFITGRGLHSNGRPRVKPAVMKRLRERGLNFSERNPGLLTAKVCANDKLSYQVA